MSYFYENTKLLIHENASETIVETAAILSTGSYFCRERIVI